MNGSSDALATLADHYGSQIPEGVAIRRIKGNQGTTDVLLRVREAFVAADSHPLDPWSQPLAAVLDQLTDDQAAMLLDDPRIRDRVRAEVFTATNPAALRCLGNVRSTASDPGGSRGAG